MHETRLFTNSLRGLAYVLLASLLMLTGTAYSQQTSNELRIGLRTKQSEVRLQGTVPVQIILDGQLVLEIPAEQVLVFRAKDAGLTLSDVAGKLLLTAEKAVHVRLNPMPAAPEGENVVTPPPTPLIRLLGPTKHYDGKPDRPYRGLFSILPQKDGLTVINIVEVEPYLYGVVSSEMSPGYPKEALKAQAIAARTYALKNIGRMASSGFDLDDTAYCQVYGGFFSEDSRTTEAIDATAGMVLAYEGKLIDAVYSSTCGGVTESAQSAWGKPVPYLTSVVDCPEDGPPMAVPTTEGEWTDFFKVARAWNCLQPRYAKIEAFRWVKLMTRKELESGLPEAYRVGTVQKIVPGTRGSSGRITSLKLEGSDRTVTIAGESSIRRAFGNLRSSAFVVDSYPDENGLPVVFVFWGGGWGHGIGMCQVGAVGLASQGWSHEKILLHYYRNVAIVKR